MVAAHARLLWDPMSRTSRTDDQSDSAEKLDETLITGPQTFIAMTIWQKRDWQQFYELARRHVTHHTTAGQRGER